MQQIRVSSLPAKIHEALSRWMEGIVKVQTCRRDEIVNAINRHQSKNPQLQKEKGYSNLKCMIKLVIGYILVQIPSTDAVKFMQCFAFLDV